MLNKLGSALSNLFSRFQSFWRELPWWNKSLLTLIVGGGSLVIIRSVFFSFSCDVKTAPAQFVSPGGRLNNQVIVTGTAADIQAVVEPLGLTLIEDCSLGYLNSRRDPNPDLTAEQRRTLRLQLYEVPNAKTSDDVKQVVTQINDARGEDSQNPERYIYADVNDVISVMDAYDTCYLPNAGGGSGGGTPFGDPGSLPDADSVSDNIFVSQWAFQDHGISLTSPSLPTGRGVKEVVFDTLPYRITVPSIIIRRNKLAFPSPMWFTTWDMGGSTLTSSHGLFIAAQIHAIAPDSSIRLIRVLNDDGCGELWVLIKAIHDYTSRMSFWTGRLDKTVFNLSLAVDNDAPANEVLTLEKTLDEAYRRGAIIIAAAGNDSSNSPTPLEMRAPANSPNVIGVAAITKDGTWSCYSNKGDVAAPGGNGGIEPGTSAPRPCVPRANTWDQNPNPCDPADMANCQYGVISVVETRDGPREALWGGTSFAAPHAAGVAALVYQKRTQQQVLCLIQAGARQNQLTTPPDFLQWGVLDMDDTLSNPTVLKACGVTP